MSRQTERWSISVDVEGNEFGVAPYRFVVAGLAALLGLSFGLSLFSVSPIMPVIIDEYEINRTTAGLLTSLTFLAHAGFAIPGSMLVGRVGISAATRLLNKQQVKLVLLSETERLVDPEVAVFASSKSRNIERGCPEPLLA